jgi:hypothetical protein
MMHLAWLRATSRNPEVRDGKQSVALSEKLNAATGGRNAAVLDTLAAGYAENNDFTNAIRTAEEALNLIQDTQLPLAEKISERLEMYQNKQPYREIDDG